MPDFPTYDELRRVARDEVLSKNGKVTLGAIERDGSDANAVVAGIAAAADEVVGQLIDAVSGLYLDSAQGQKLDRWAFDRYGLLRKDASVAQGSVEFRTTTANPAPFTIAAGTRLQTSDGHAFVTVEAATFPAASTGPVVVEVRSVVAGADQQAAASTITSISDSVTGSPADLAVSNSLATAGAADAESDDSLRDRCRRFWTAARRGTLRALEAGALAVGGVRTASALEAIDALGRPARLVQLVVADAFTDALVQQDANPPTYQAQSQALARSVFNGLSDVRAAGIYVQVTVAQVVMQPIVLALTYVAGVDVDEVALVARATVAARVNSLAPGAPLRRADVVEWLKSVDGLSIHGSEVQSPAGDVEVKSLQVARTTLAMVSVGSIQSNDPPPTLVGTNPDQYAISREALGL